MSERDPIAELLSADEETFWRLVAEMRMSGPETRKASPLLLAGTESEVRKKRKIQQDVRQKSQPLIEEMRERGPSHEERYAISCDSLLLCVEGTRSRFSVPVSGYDSRAIVAYATKAIYLTDWKRLVEAVAGAISSLAEGGLVRLDAEDCRAICELISPPPDAFASPQNGRSRGRSIYEVRHDQGDMREIKLDDLKSKLKLLADRLSVDPELVALLLRECPHECQVLRDRLSDPAMIQHGTALEDATLSAIPEKSVTESTKKKMAGSKKRTASEKEEAKRMRHEFARRLVAAREAACMTQEQLAERTGMLRPAIGRYEVGGALPQGYQLKRLAVALGVASSDLFPETWENTPTNS